MTRLTNEEFHAWCQRNNIEPETATYIQRLRIASPERKVRGRASNVSGRDPSQKMGFSIQFESQHVELWGCHTMERDEDVLEYYDQPTRIQLHYHARSGRKISPWHILHAQLFSEGPGTTLSLLDLLAIPRTNPSAPLFAPTLKALHQQIEERYGLAQGTTTHDLPESYVIKARIVTSVVETVRRLVEADERRAKARGEAILHQQAIRRALISVNKTTIRMQVKGTSQDIKLHAGLTTYYKYECLYETLQVQNHCSLRRVRFCQKSRECCITAYSPAPGCF